jgi:hypothetical protein
MKLDLLICATLCLLLLSMLINTAMGEFLAKRVGNERMGAEQATSQEAEVLATEGSGAMPKAQVQAPVGFSRTLLSSLFSGIGFAIGVSIVAAAVAVVAWLWFFYK